MEKKTNVLQWLFVGALLGIVAGFWIVNAMNSPDPTGQDAVNIPATMDAWVNQVSAEATTYMSVVTVFPAQTAVPALVPQPVTIEQTAVPVPQLDPAILLVTQEPLRAGFTEAEWGVKIQNAIDNQTATLALKEDCYRAAAEALAELDPFGVQDCRAADTAFNNASTALINIMEAYTTGK